MATIDFSAAYRDSARGSTLKALAERRKALAEATLEAAQPRQISAPSQGWAQIAGTVGAGIREGRAVAEENAGRQQLAQLLAGGLSGDEIGQAMILDPDLAMKYQQHQWESEATKAEREAREAELLRARGWSVEDATARIEADKAAAAEAARVAAESQGRQFGQQTTLQEDTQAEARAKAEADAKREQEKAAQLAETQAEQTRLGAALGSDEAKLAEGLKQGTISQEAYDQGMASIAAKRKKESLTPGQTTMEQEYAKEYGEWTTQGRSQAVANATQLAKAAQDLTKSQGWFSDLTGVGATSGRVTGLLPESLTKFINPKAVSTRDAVRSVAQESLKAVLGAQFAQMEGQQVLERAFDPGQPPEENLRRVQLLSAKLAQIAAQREAKAQYYDQTGMIEGFKGPDLNQAKADFMTLMGEFDATTAPTPAPAAAAPAGGATAAPAGGDATAAPAAPAAPAIGTVKGDYTYIGGDPSKPESWKKN